MSPRRALGFFLLLLLVAASVGAQEGAVPQTPGDAAWDRLMTGNREFIDGTVFRFDDIVARRLATSTKQSPRISVVACADSRVGPELLFHQSLGDLFIVRTAGNVVDDFAIASLEYAAEHEWTDLIVILGHTSCGAVDAALRPSDPPTPALQMLVNRIRESFLDIPYSDAPNPELIRRAAAANARQVASHLSAHSPALRERIRSGRVQIVAAVQDLATGEVTRVNQ